MDKQEIIDYVMNTPYNVNRTILSQMLESKSDSGGSGGSTDEWIGDGNTHIWITLPENRTSPMLGVCPNGTVTVDWGDGTTPDVLTGTDIATVKWTPNHEYAKPGDYIITLTVDGSMEFRGYSSDRLKSYLLRHSSGTDGRNIAYQNAIRKIEIGSGVTSVNYDAFSGCYSLASVVIPESVTSIGEGAFDQCRSLTSIVIPEGIMNIDDSTFSQCYSLTSIVIPEGVTSIGDGAFNQCHSLTSIVIPDSVTSIGKNAFQNCYALESIVIPNSVTSIGDTMFNSCYLLASVVISNSITSIDKFTFYKCHTLGSIVIPNSVTSIGDSAFSNCHSLTSIVIPDSVTSIGSSTFNECHSLTSIAIPGGVMSIGSSTFLECYGIRYYDFTKHTAVPALANTNAFKGIPADCEIRVPAALYDEWIAATNWANYTSNIVAV